jgi:hypothetical protein
VHNKRAKPTLRNHEHRYRQRNKERGIRDSDETYIFSTKQEEAPGYEDSGAHTTTHHDQQILIKVLHIQIIPSELRRIIQSKPENAHET